MHTDEQANDARRWKHVREALAEGRSDTEVGHIARRQYAVGAVLVPRKRDPVDVLREIAAGLPTDEEWRSAADCMEAVASILDEAGYGELRPAHYEEDWR